MLKAVGAKEYGQFLITIFDERVRNDVARYYVRMPVHVHTGRQTGTELSL
jgi:sulfatase maturation enzyme AslB (radical SAM superfamily)